jgi:biopolymer transport protein ExbB
MATRIPPAVAFSAIASPSIIAYVGLLGTVLAIMLTFWQVSQADNLSTQAIMLGLAMALKATAGGILVAIPSMMLYNILMRKAEVIQLLVKERYEKV